jgi:hypothetical protein
LLANPAVKRCVKISRSSRAAACGALRLWAM